MGSESQRPWTTPVERVAEFIRRFVFVGDESVYTLLSLWVLATFFAARFDYAPYLFVFSPDRRSGKSRLLEVLDALVWRPSGILHCATNAGVFRTAQGRTQLMDEIDSWQNTADLRSVLNAGFRRGNTVARMERGSDGSFVEVKFPVFAFRALAGIGLGILDDTTKDRCLLVRMVRQTKEERREPFRLRKLKEELTILADTLGAFQIAYSDSVGDQYDQPFPYLEQFSDRTIDIAEPLAAVLEAVYEDDPRYEAALSEFLRALSLTRHECEEATLQHQILKTLAGLAQEGGSVIGNATELAEMCSRATGSEHHRYSISTALRNCGFKTKSARLGGTPKYRYSLSYEELRDLVERYSSSPSDETVADGDV